MTLRQTFLKLIYPFWMMFTKASGKNAKVFKNERLLQPKQNFYDLSVQLNNKQSLSFAELKGKKILLVNTASDCGYTNQYDHLQKLHEQYKHQLVIIGFPANDFKEQEKGNDEEIAQFCKMNFGVTFPLVQKSSVIKSPEQNEVFQWLTDKTKNGWTNKQPSWNFSKYLVNEQGILTHYFDPSISPLDKEIISAITS